MTLPRVYVVVLCQVDVLTYSTLARLCETKLVDLHGMTL